MWKEINSNIHKGAYQLTGEGTTVVLIHGFGETGNVWKQQQAALEQHFQVIIPALPGSGNSPLAEDVSMEGMADFVRTILAAEQVEKAIIIGHSMGGYVTLAMAAQYPELFMGLGLFHSTAKADSEEKIEARRKSIKMIQRYGAETFIRQTQPNMLSAASRKRAPQLIEDCIQEGLQCPPESLIAYYEAMIARPDRTAVLRSLPVPALFIIGKDDNAIPMDNILPQVSLPSISSIHIFEDVGHLGMWEEADKSNLVLRQFVEFCQHRL